jgi:hypothetical protein
MHSRGPWRLTLVAMLASLTVLAQLQAGAQTNELDTESRARLAAIPLIASEMPAGYTFAGEGFLPVERTGVQNVDPQQLVELGFQGLYRSDYRPQGAGGGISSYAWQWSDAAAAEEAFAIVEDETVTQPDAGATDAPLEAGTGSAELTTVTVVDAAGATLSVTDASFVIDRYIVGVTVVTPVEAPIDPAAVTAMVDTLEARAGTALAGQAPAGTDLAVPGTVIDVRPLGTEIQAGYLSAGESEALYGVTGSVLGGMRTSWVAAVATGEAGAAPYISVSASVFEDADQAARVVAQSGELVPLTIDLQPVDAFAINGAESARGFQYASASSVDGSPDSFRGVIQIGTTVVVVDVQGATSLEPAFTTVTALLDAQVRCAAGDCTLPEISLG